MEFELTPTALRDFDEIPADWTKVTLQSIAEIFDCPHSTPLLTDSGPYLVRTQDVRSGMLELDTLARVSEETYLARVKRAIPQFGDLLYSREGTYFGSSALVPDGARVCLGQRMVHIRPDRSNVDHVFLKYWLNSPMMARHISGLRDGTVAERLNMSTIRALPVAFPDLPIQKEISSILRVFDSRVDLLRQTNTTLEATAQALFKSWFVDFDPVHAKAEGREPEAMDAATAALFPSEFEESELGPIPKGWRVRRLADSLSVQIGGAWGEEREFKKSTVSVSCLRGIDAVDIGVGTKPNVPVRCVSPKQIASRTLAEGDILVEGSGSFCGRSLYWISSYSELVPLTPTYSNFVKRLKSPSGCEIAYWASLHLTQVYGSG